MFINSRSKTKNYQAIYDKIFADAVGYVKKYDKPKCWIEGGLYYARVHALVSTQKFEQNWAAIAHTYHQENNPRIIMVIGESTVKMVNELELDLRYAHFWAMDEWVLDGKEVPTTHPLSFERAGRELCFDRIRPNLRMPEENLHFPKADLAGYIESWNKARCVVMQGGQGDVKHWAFNDPVRREGPHKDDPPTPKQYRSLASRLVDLHPITLMQNARI